MEKLKLRYDSYVSSLNRLEEAINSSKNEDNSVLIDGTIQRFEFVMELAWKLIKQYLEYEEIGEFNSPRSAIKEAYKIGIIENGEIWLDMITDRNLTSHTYDEETANNIYLNIINNYFSELKNFKNEIGSKIYDK